MKISEITQDPIMKMHGCGNDFVVMTDFGENITPEHAKIICDRHFGIGSDGLITVLHSRVPAARYRMKFFNPDGSLAEMCGNGIRCFAKYLVDTERTGSEMDVDTDAGIISPQIRVVGHSDAESLVRVNMGKPVLYNPMQLSENAMLNKIYLKQEVMRGRIEGLEYTFVSMGNPHAVIFTNTPDEDAKKYGSIIEHRTDIFPKKTNVEFVRVNSPTDLTMRVWERGAGETLACGTGACASLVASVLKSHSNNQAIVHLLGGDLDISWKGKGEPVYMTGPARNVYEIDTRSLDKYLFEIK